MKSAAAEFGVQIGPPVHFRRKGGKVCFLGADMHLSAGLVIRPAPCSSREITHSKILLCGPFAPKNMLSEHMTHDAAEMMRKEMSGWR